MSRAVKKLNQLKNTESFIQSHTIRGFKYIDKAGEIVNIYHRGTNIPNFSMSLDGLIIQNPIEKIETLKITPTFIWMRFTEIDNLGTTARIFIAEFEKICKTLEITQIGRIGWRNYFIYEFVSEKQEKTFFERIKILDNTQTEFLRLKIDIQNKFEGTLMVQPLARSDNPEKKAILFDIDLFKREELTATNIPQTLNSFKEYLHSDDFLSLVNDFLR